MDYSKVAKAKTYFEAVELLRPLIERAESVGCFYEISVKRYYDNAVWVELNFRSDLSANENDADVTMVLYEDDHSDFYLRRKDKRVMGFFSSQEIDEQLDLLFMELSND